MPRRPLVAVGLALAGLVPGAPAAAEVSANWGGYALTGARYRTVAAAWTQPAARCSSGRSYSAFWVGLGGYAPASTRLEQIGTESDCAAAGHPVYRAWYELVPAGSVELPLVIHAGDRVSAVVSARASRVTLAIADATTGRSYRRTMSMRSPDLTSAEWIAEAPSECDGAGACVTLPLANFGSLAFSSLAATTASGLSGGLTLAGSRAQSIALSSSTGRGGGGRYAAGAVSRNAAPSAPSGDGRSFTIAYSESAAPSGPGPGDIGPPGGRGFGYRRA